MLITSAPKYLAFSHVQTKMPQELDFYFTVINRYELNLVYGFCEVNARRKQEADGIFTKSAACCMFHEQKC